MHYLISIRKIRQCPSITIEWIAFVLSTNEGVLSDGLFHHQSCEIIYANFQNTQIHMKNPSTCVVDRLPLGRSRSFSNGKYFIFNLFKVNNGKVQVNLRLLA